MTITTTRADAAFAALNVVQDAYNAPHRAWADARKAFQRSQSQRRYDILLAAQAALDDAANAVDAAHDACADAQVADLAEERELAAAADRAASPTFTF
jgi:hypothetical protein